MVRNQDIMDWVTAADAQAAMEVAGLDPDEANLAAYAVREQRVQTVRGALATVLLDRHAELLERQGEVQRGLDLTTATLRSLSVTAPPGDSTYNPKLNAEFRQVPSVTLLLGGATSSRDRKEYVRLRRTVSNYMPDIHIDQVGRLTTKLLSANLPKSIFAPHSGRGLTFLGGEQLTDTNITELQKRVGRKTAERMLVFFGRVAADHPDTTSKD